MSSAQLAGDGFKPFVIYRGGVEIVIGRALVTEETEQLQLDLFETTEMKEK